MTAVEQLRVRACTIPTDVPEADGTLTWDSTTVVLVEADAAGTTGLGWTYAPAAAAAVVEDLLAPVVRGRDATDVAGSWSAMVRAIRNAGRPGLVGMAVSAVDIALWDLAARRAGVGLPELWGRAPAPVPVYGSGGFTTYDDHRTRAQVEHWLGLGCAAVKIKIGESWGTRTERDLDRTAFVRDLAGPEVDVFVDANGAYTDEQAVSVGERLDALGVTWFEEPVSSRDLEGLAHVRDQVRADVTAGEYGYDLDDARRTAPVVDCLQVDVTRCGGYTEWLRIAADPALDGVPLSGHCAPYLTLPAAAVTPALRHLEYFWDHVRIEQGLFEGTADPVDGALAEPAGPGHGLRLREDAVARYRVR